MPKTKALIVDDEPGCIENLRLLLKEYCPNIEVAGTASNISEAMLLVQAQQPQLLFLDIEMPYGSGFELLQYLPKEQSPAIVFVTAYDQYAIEAIRHSAIDYLLKPIDIDQLQEAVKKAINRVREKGHYQSISLLMQKLGHLATDKKISLPTATGLMYVDIKEIIRCQADNYCTWFHFTNRPKMLVTRTLKEYDAQLSPFGFVRVHASHLINLKHVTQYHRGRGGWLIMSDGSNVDVSQQKKDELLDQLNDQTGGE
jgi:two-component system, LytTR family, response regulator